MRREGEETRGEKNEVEGRLEGNKGEGKDAAWQADGCPVYWFIRCFSHEVPRPAMKQTGDSLLVLESIMQRGYEWLFSLIKTHPRTRFTFNYDGRQRNYFASTNFYSVNIRLFCI